jgi:YVTN family beta-propeller protein
MVSCLLALGACNDEPRDDGDDRAALPPGLAGRAVTNADVAPPAVPFSPATPRDTARATASWPHDSAAYTQGLLVTDGRLLESTGITGQSTVREVDLETGRVLRAHALPRHHFGEGIAVVGDRLYQLTWKAGQGYVYDVASLTPVDSFAYRGEGWGLASDGTSLYMSDGGSDIRVLDPATRQVTRTIPVSEAGRRVHALNELEWIDGELWANVYQTDWIARIDPATGQVRRWLHVGRLLTDAERRRVQARQGVANGIAWDSARRRVLVTGKHWPRLFALALPR